MLRLTRGWMFVVCMALMAAPAAGESGFTNMLWNPAFEMGAGTPDGWTGFGFCERDWAFRGRDGSRCLSITADGRTPGWWYASRLPEIEHNALYRLSFWARSGTEESAEGVVVGLNLCSRRIEVGPEWRRYELFLRAPEYLSDVKVCFGEDRLNGTVLFDDVALEPAVAVHRSEGPGGGLSLGEGERIRERRYRAVHVLSDPMTNDRRFLERYTADVDGDRWVFDDGDEVVYRHEVARLGVGLLPPDATPQNVAVLPGMPVHQVVTDPRAKRNFAHGRMVIEVQVDRCDRGSLAVDVSRDGRTWKYVDSIQGVGRHELTVIEELTPALCPYVRLKSEAEKVEVSRYRFSSVVGGGRNVDAIGSSRYLVVLFSTPELKVDVQDVADAASRGVNEVNMTVKNEGERVAVEVDAWIEGGEAAEVPSKEKMHLATGSMHPVSLEYSGELRSDRRLFVRGRNAATGELLFLLEGLAGM